MYPVLRSLTFFHLVQWYNLDFSLPSFFIYSFHIHLSFLLSDMPGRKNCVVAYANVRGLHANLVDLGALMAAGRCDVMVCAETLVSTRRHPAELRVTGYSYYGVTSVDSRPTARGMSVYVHQGYPCVRKSCYECSCHEVVCLEDSSQIHELLCVCSVSQPWC